jgi:hypothetical protein
MVSRVVAKVISENDEYNYAHDIHDTLKYGQYIGEGEPKDWMDAVRRCGYDVFEEEGGFYVQERYGAFGRSGHIDPPKDVVAMLRDKYGMNVRCVGEMTTLNGDTVKRFKFV